MTCTRKKMPLTINEKIDNLHCIKMKNLGVHQKMPLREQKASHTWKEVFATHRPNRGLVSTTRLKVLEVPKKKRENPIKDGRRFICTSLHKNCS